MGEIEYKWPEGVGDRGGAVKCIGQCKWDQRGDSNVGRWAVGEGA